MIKREDLKEGTPFKISEDEVNEVIRALEDYWNELCKEFNVSSKMYPLIIDRIGNFQESYYKAFKEWSPDFSETNEFLKNISMMIKPSATMTTAFMGIAKDDSVVQFVYCSFEIIMEKLLIGKNIPKEKGNYMEHVIEHLKITLRHEMGHVLHNIALWVELSKKDNKKFDELLVKESTEFKKGYDNLMKEFEGYYRDEMFYKKYHNLPGEAEANFEVGLTWEDHWKWRLLTEVCE